MCVKLGLKKENEEPGSPRGDFHMPKLMAERFRRGKLRKCAVAGKQCLVSFSGPCKDVLFCQNAEE